MWKRFKISMSTNLEYFATPRFMPWKCFGIRQNSKGPPLLPRVSIPLAFHSLRNFRTTELQDFQHPNLLRNLEHVAINFHPKTFSFFSTSSCCFLSCSSLACEERTAKRFQQRHVYKRSKTTWRTKTLPRKTADTEVKRPAGRHCEYHAALFLWKAQHGASPATLLNFLKHTCPFPVKTINLLNRRLHRCSWD